MYGEYTFDDLIEIYHSNLCNSEMILEKIIIRGLGIALENTSSFKNDYVRVWANQAKIHMENRKEHDNLYLVALNGCEEDKNYYIEYYKNSNRNFFHILRKLENCVSNISLSITEL